MAVHARHSWYRIESGVEREGGGILKNARGWFFLSTTLQSAREFQIGTWPFMLFPSCICQGGMIKHILYNCEFWFINFKYVNIWYVGLHFNSCFKLT